MANKKTPKNLILDIDDELSIQNIHNIWSKIMKSSSKNDLAGINFRNASQADLAGLQLVHSLSGKYRLKNPGFMIKMNIPPETYELYNKTGFSEITALIKH
jgi:ABC-type transporter Mla MlaB component